MAVCVRLHAIRWCHHGAFCSLQFALANRSAAILSPGITGYGGLVTRMVKVTHADQWLTERSVGYNEQDED